ncbi:GspH/FimT family protein [Simiduia agarivorans]
MAGHTLLELLIYLTLLAILTVSATSLSNLYSTVLFRINAQALLGLVSATRETAVNTRSHTFLCPSSDTVTCSPSWTNQYYLLIVDINGNAQPDPSDRILRVTKIPQSIRISWQAFGNKSTLRFTPDGVTDNQNGRFRLCHTDLSDLQPATIIVNKAGRPRLHFIPDDKSPCSI